MPDRPDHLSPEQLDLVAALVLLRDKISLLVVRVTTEGPTGAPWAELADVLDRTAVLCRREVVLDVEYDSE